MAPENTAQADPATAPKKPRGMRTDVKLLTSTIAVLSSFKRLTEAVIELTRDMKLYHGVKLSQIAEAVYKQGRKDGAREVFEQMDGLKARIPYRNPGHPKKRKK